MSLALSADNRFYHPKDRGRPSVRAASKRLVSVLTIFVTLAVGAAITQIAVAGPTPNDVVGSELQMQYLEYSAARISNSLDGESDDSGPRRSIPRFIVLKNLYSRTAQTGARAEIARRLQADYRKLSKVEGIPDLANPSGIRRVLEDFLTTVSKSSPKSDAAADLSDEQQSKAIVRDVLGALYEGNSVADDALFYSALALEVSSTSDDKHGYVRILSTIAVLAMKSGDLYLALGAFLEADITIAGLKAMPFSGNIEDLVMYAQNLSESGAYIRYAKETIDEAVFQGSTAQADKYTKDKDYDNYMRTVAFASDIFTLTSNLKYFWITQYMLALGEKEAKKPAAQLAYLVTIADSFVSIEEDQAKTLLEDEFTKRLLATVLPMATDLVKTLVAERGATSDGADRYLNSAYSTMNALRRSGELLGKRGAHIEALLIVTTLEMNKDERDAETIATLYQEMLDTYPLLTPLLGSSKEVMDAIDAKYMQLNLILFTMLFDLDASSETGLAFANRIYNLSLAGLALHKNTTTEEVQYRLLWAEHLLRHKRHSNALTIYREADEIAIDGTNLPGLMVTEQLYTFNFKGFLYNRMGLAHYRLGESKQAYRYLKKSLTACRQGTDPLCEIRTELTLALVDHHEADWNMGRSHANTALDLVLKLRIDEEKNNRASSSEAKEFTSGLGTLGALVGDNLEGIMKSTFRIAAIRMEHEQKGLFGTVNATANPRPPFLTDMLHVPEPERAKFNANAPAYVEQLTAMGRTLSELGDPIEAERLLEKAEGVARNLGLKEQLAAALFLQSRIYSVEQRYFSVLNTPPTKLLRWSISGEDPTNIIVARNKLDEALQAIDKDEASLLRLSILARGIKAAQSDPPDEEAAQRWVLYGKKEFSAQKSRFRSEVKFVNDAKYRRALADLYHALDRYAQTLDERGDALHGKNDLPGALATWRASKELYEVIDDYTDAGELMRKEAGIWRYLSQPERELELLESATRSIEKGRVSYLPPSDDKVVSIPDVKLSLDGKSAIHGIRFDKYHYYVEPGPIEQVAENIDPGIHLTLISSYLGSQQLDRAKAMQKRLFSQFADDTVMGLMVRSTLGGMYLSAGQLEEALRIIETTYQRTLLEYEKLETNLPAGEAELDLSRNSISFQGGEAADFDFDMGSLMHDVFDYKNWTLLKIYTTFLYGKALSAVGRFDAAVETLEESAELAKRHKLVDLAADAYHLLGRLYQPVKQTTALSYFTKAYELTPTPEAPPTIISDRMFAIQIRESLGQFYFAKEEWDNARRYDWEAAQAYEKVRAQLGVQELQSPLMRRLSDVYERLVLATRNDALKQPRPAKALKSRELIEQAFKYSESAKSRALLDIIGGGATPVSSQNTKSATQAAEAALRARIDALSKEIEALRSPGKEQVRRVKQGELSQLRQRFATIGIERKMEQAANLFRTAVTPAELKQLQEVLRRVDRQDKRETLLVSFFITRNELFVWTISKDAIDWETITVSSTALEEMVDSFRAKIDAPPVAQESTDPLYETLFGKISGRIGNKRLLIVPHGVLHSLPFGVLRHDDKYLAETNAIHYLPSASLMLVLLSQTSKRVEKALIFADPDGTLQYTRVESSKIGRILGPKQTKSLEGPEATRENLFRYLPDYTIIHFATHGTFNKNYPLFSSLKLADGELLLSDVSRTRDFAADTVVLSACNTGVNQIKSGDELVGLAGSFIKAGAVTLLVNLWSAEDDTTPILVERFYRHMLHDKMPKDLALKKAKESMIEEGYAPISWGGFILIGNVMQ